jgi:hypothetical protein
MFVIIDLPPSYALMAYAYTQDTFAFVLQTASVIDAIRWVCLSEYVKAVSNEFTFEISS